MNDAVCFRCDWQGRRLGRACPKCGAPLFRPSDAVRADADIEEPSPSRGAATTLERSRAALGLVAAVAVVAIVALELLAPAGIDPTPRVSRADRSAGPGKLVMVAGEDGNHALWVLDLASGGSQRGPAVPGDVAELVDVSSADFGAIGIERRLSDGRTVVSLLHPTELDAVVEWLGTADLVAWGPEGRTLVFATNREGPGECSRVRIRLLDLRTRTVQWALDDPSFCGPVVSTIRSAAATYFTAPSGDRLGVYLTGSVGVSHLTFDGPLTVGRGGNWLVVDRVLAWSSDGADVALVGSLGATSGVFRLDAGSGTEVREPDLVFASPDVLDATFGPDGSLFLTRPAEIVVERHGSISRLPLPEGARGVTGPILWVP